MGAFGLSIALVALCMAAGARATPALCGTKGASYDPATGANCYAGQYACAAGLCACPYQDNSNYDCYWPFSNGGSYGCPTPPPSGTKVGLVYRSADNSRGYCAASTSGDPLVESFSGCKWYLTGKPDTVMNLISEANHVVNTYLVKAELTDMHHGGSGTNDVNGTFHGGISVRYREAYVVAMVNADGNLTVRLDNNTVPFGATRESNGLTLKVTEHYPYFGQVAEILTPAFRFFVHAVQPYDTPAGWSRGHLDFSATAVAGSMDMHGLLGQHSHENAGLCDEDFKFHGDGKEEDYALPSLDSVDYKYSLFNVQKSSRRLHSANHPTSQVSYELASIPLKAGSAALM